MSWSTGVNGKSAAEVKAALTAVEVPAAIADEAHKAEAGQFYVLKQHALGMMEAGIYGELREGDSFGCSMSGHHYAGGEYSGGMTVTLSFYGTVAPKPETTEGGV